VIRRRAAHAAEPEDDHIEGRSHGAIVLLIRTRPRAQRTSGGRGPQAPGSAGYGSAEGSDFFSATTSSWRDSLP
jgi:hypothetical protein